MYNNVICVSERNQQVMCGAGLGGAVLRVCGAALRCERHALHAPAMYMLERLAAHALSPTELRSVHTVDSLGVCHAMLVVSTSYVSMSRGTVILT